MVCWYNDEFEVLVKEVKKVMDKGEVVSYIFVLVKVDKYDLLVVIYYFNNICLLVGDVEKIFIF